MIKHVAKGIQNKGVGNREEMAYIVKLSIERNFGGKLEAAEIMGKIFA